MLPPIISCLLFWWNKKHNPQNKMKKILLLCICSLFAMGSAKAQECEYLKNEKDEFTGKKITETWGKFIREFTGSNANIVFRKVDSTYLVLVNYNVQYPKAMVVGINDKLMLKLVTDYVINLESIGVASGTMNTVARITTTQIIVTYRAKKEDLDILSNFAVAKARMYFTDGYMEHEVKPKNGEEIKNAIRCLLFN